MNLLALQDKDQIELHFRKNTDLNLYQLGDLDDFFWKFTDWQAAEEDGEIKQIILIYKGTDLPVMIALCDKNENIMRELLINLEPRLPEKFYSHLSKGLAEVLRGNYNFEKHGTYLKMSLQKNDLVLFAENPAVRRLEVTDIEQIKKFYEESYPDNWFDKRMLESGKYFGYFINDKLAGIAGIHVYSGKYKVAVLGNITTDPVHRGRSICTNLTSALCADLFETVDNIGLNVHSENTAAIKSYGMVGFKITGEYEEYMFKKKF
ncbi:MAG: GNAT family N-acetyltransferase [bacterium]|nr:GNAT family N-acetyltransferase [bacterium]